MTSLARRHFQKTMAKQESEKAAESTLRPDLNQYELMQAQLHEHKLQLSNIQSVETKAKKKAEILPVYDAYIEGVLEADAGIQDDVLMRVLIWHIDAGSIDTNHYEQALPLAAYAVKHGLTPPDEFKRTTATIIAEDIAEAALKNDMPLALLQQTAELVMPADMPDEVKGKLHKALGKHPQLQEQEPKTALNHLQSADSKMKKPGVKTDIKNLQKQIAAAEEQQKEQQQPE